MDAIINNVIHILILTMGSVLMVTMTLLVGFYIANKMAFTKQKHNTDCPYCNSNQNDEYW